MVGRTWLLRNHGHVYARVGVPAVFAFLAIAAEFYGGLGLILGLLGRVSAFGITCNLLVLAMTGAIMVTGSGAFSVDRALMRREHRVRHDLSPTTHHPQPSYDGTSFQARAAELDSSVSRICNWRRPSVNCGYSIGAAGSSTDS